MTLIIPGIYWVLNICHTWWSYDTRTNIVIILHIRKLRFGKLNLFQVSDEARVWNQGVRFHKLCSLPRQLVYCKCSINISCSFYWYYYFEIKMVLVEKCTTCKQKSFFLNKWKWIFFLWFNNCLLLL